ncbi:MAG: primosomal protein N' [Armatimonadetes bacterium CG_4_10_14_3_um_filter_66_18]|nr:primosomal protein N' [Armatimonadota bacterium]PIU90154.1 MAG: primosomal protein N' [Armatimonadetes bacterium CG06_land_8_20_14_3_00_66_21]PIX37707.1 MAG: primosomal protein N' [Armatimonadetes bacterium CG_4_8_14_3_um_filter_66_20]PIY49884.1 MAG: primosomal protein N' [Armatimonadetes bacterium CG_4_10_14_3_um_filter_66_18]PIZ30899.1 MAG: primosomal protein N' [Armatimonadetes bacterium CG_4_10_14_0_8_um_filter_66_14]PJB61702.1 MAG: primosomal protein N' [Armatimonadetes bacterium CG_4_
MAGVDTLFGPSSSLVDVCLDRAGRSLPDAFTYSVPVELADRVVLGSQVLVPLQRGRAMGYVVGFPKSTELKRLRGLLSVESDFPAFDEHLLALARWMSKYYLCSLVDCLRTIVPRGLQRTAEVLFDVVDPLAAQRHLETLDPSGKEAQVLALLLGSDRPVSRAELRKEVAGDFSPALQHLVADGLAEEQSSVSPAKTRARMARVAELTDAGREALLEVKELARRAPRQAALLERLAARPGPTPLAALEAAGSGMSAVANRLAELGWILLYQIEDLRRPDDAFGGDGGPVELEAQQRAALQQLRQSLDSGARKTFMVHGVTASGKTEVYLGAVEHVLGKGKQAIVLVPEISLTAQLMGLFRARFGDRVAILHSRLSAGERFDEWRRLRRGEAQVAVGARSAVFAPCPNLGLIVVDEEHEPSYKQDLTPRYHARTVAEQRATMAKACLVLGSATPSLESYYRAMVGTYRLLSLPRRVRDRPLPTISLIDMRRETTWTDGLAETLSQPLVERLGQHVAAGGQVILFLNRRGFSTVLLCSKCGEVARCDHCDVSLTYHRPDHSLRCHHCDLRRPTPEFCPQCEGTEIFLRGAGTQKVEAELAERLPHVRVLRMDRDTTRRRGAHVHLLRDFVEKKADLLLGTQMVAKGLDFPSVTLVGIVSADTALTLPDFRASERAFQLLTQVSGRAGRGESPGEVVIQTYNPEHFSILCAIRQNYEEFFSQEMAQRRELPYPPFAHLVNLIISDEDEAVAAGSARRAAQAVIAAAGTNAGQTEVVGPAPCPLARLRGRWRHHFLVRDASRARLTAVLTEALGKLTPEDRSRLTVDVDAVTLL